ncbi:MAG: class I SAM-dependent methyltransferase, partial [Bacteroidetes bacterium]
VIPELLRKNWQLIQLPDRIGLPKAIKLLNGPLDLCHYDSDKSYAGRMWAYPRLWKALKTGGIFVSDDVGDNLGFFNFAEKIQVNPVIVAWNDKYIGILRKE